MTRRLLVLTFLVTACSQRSPWVLVAAPASRVPPLATVEPATAPADATAVAHLGTLRFPVAGIDSTRLDDSYNDPRDGGARSHRAIDIMAPRGSAVLSVQDGRILRLAKNDKGGTTLYATDMSE